MHYVIGDVHGCYKELMALLKRIERKDPDAEYIFVGDFVDRGPDVDKVLRWCMKNVRPTGKYRSVMGNHEDLLIEWYYHDFRTYLKYNKTHREGHFPDTQFDFDDFLLEHDYVTDEKVKPFIEWMESLPLSIDIHVNGIDYKIVHAWHRFDLTDDIRIRDCNLWVRECNGNHQNDVVIVYGHTPTISEDYTYYSMYPSDRPGMIAYRKNAINVDGGCVFQRTNKWFPAMLCGICLETLEEFYSSATVLNRFKQVNPGSAKREADDYKKEYLIDWHDDYRDEILHRLSV